MVDNDNGAQRPEAGAETRAPKAKTFNIDTEWFKARLYRAGKSSNGLGDHLGIAGSQASRMINGTRAMKFEEVPKVARYLGESVNEVLRRAGLPTRDDAPETITASSIIDADYNVLPADEPLPLPPLLSERAAAMVPHDKQDTIATALVRAPKGALSIMDDNVVVHEAAWSEPRVMGTMSLVKLRDGVVLANKITQASKTGDVTLVMADGSTRKERAESIKPVIVVLQ